jgi:hypothetical protein
MRDARTISHRPALGRVLAESISVVLTFLVTRRHSRAMPGHRPHLLLRRRQLRSWAALLAAFALVVWVVEIASHLHVAHEVQLSAQGSHFCEMCAAFQAGASSFPAPQSIAKLHPVAPRAIASVPFPRLQLVCFYRSRAPPHV